LCGGIMVTSSAGAKVRSERRSEAKAGQDAFLRPGRESARPKELRHG
jgi:hypothetical protein